MKLTVLPDPSVTMPKDSHVAGLCVLGPQRTIMFDELLDDGTCIEIGRTRHRHVRFKSMTVSCRHALISRTDDGRFKIEEWDSTNGVFIAPRGRYSEYQEVESEVLELGMIIKLGNVILAPVDTRGCCPVLVARYSEFIQMAVAVYGTMAAAAKKIGIISRWTINRLFEEFGWKRGEMS